MSDLVRVSRVVAGLALVVAVAGWSVAGGLASAGPRARTPSTSHAISRRAAVVPKGDILVVGVAGHVKVLTREGRVVLRLPWVFARDAAQAVELTPDRRGVYVAVYTDTGGAALYNLDLVTGRRHLLGSAVSPVLNPAGTKLAYASITTTSNGDTYEHALVVRDLRTGTSKSIPFPAKFPFGTPPELLINWSPDGQRIAAFDGHRARLVDVNHARDVESQSVAPGDTRRPTVWAPTFLAPVYSDTQTLVVDANCCERAQRLEAINLRSGAHRRFATLSSPPEDIRRIKPRVLLVADALRELVVVSQGHARVIATNIDAATP
jgi:hypothetical protein